MSTDEVEKQLKEALKTTKVFLTRAEQLELLKAYRSFLQRQVEFLDSRISAREKAAAG